MNLQIGPYVARVHCALTPEETRRVPSDDADQTPSERMTERDARQPVAIEQRLPKAIGPDSALVRGGLAS